MTNPSSMYRVELRWLLDRQLMHEKVAVARELPAASQQPEHSLAATCTYTAATRLKDPVTSCSIGHCCYILLLYKHA